MIRFTSALYGVSGCGSEEGDTNPSIIAAMKKSATIAITSGTESLSARLAEELRDMPLVKIHDSPIRRPAPLEAG